MKYVPPVKADASLVSYGDFKELVERVEKLEALRIGAFVRRIRRGVGGKWGSSPYQNRVGIT